MRKRVMATTRRGKTGRLAAAKKAANKKKSKSPLKGMMSRDAKRGAIPPNEQQRKFPDEVYGDTEIPFRS
jgi:hypothetical protein